MKTLKHGATTKECPRAFEHTPCPKGYIQWHHWAEQMAETHEQRRCSGCGLWTVWIPKPKKR